MKKKYRPLIIAGIALVLLAASYMLVVALLPEPVVDDTSEPLPTYYLTKYDTTDVDTILFEREDGTSYTIESKKVTNDAGAVSTNYLIAGKYQYEYDRSALGMAMMYVTSIYVNSITDAEPKDLAAYGLDTPSVRMTINPFEGEPTTVLLGDIAPVGSSYYAMVEGKPEVYLLGSYVAKYILNTDLDYRTLTLTAYTDVSTEIGEVEITRGGEPVLTVYRRTDEEADAAGTLATRYTIKQPVQRDGNDTTIPDSLLTPMAALSATSVVEDMPQDLSKYGLDKDTTVLKITNVDGTSKKLTLSSDRDGMMYGMIQGINSVYTFTTSDFSFLDVDYKTLLYKLLWLYNITDVQRVELVIRGEEHVLELFDPTDEEETAGKVFSGTLDGETVSEENGRRLYTRVLSPTLYDYVESGTTAGAAEYTFRIILDDGTVHTMELAPLNERQYLAILDGESAECYVNVTDLTNLEKAIEKVKAGEKLAMAD